MASGGGLIWHEPCFCLGFPLCNHNYAKTTGTFTQSKLNLTTPSTGKSKTGRGSEDVKSPSLGSFYHSNPTWTPGEKQGSELGRKIKWDNFLAFKLLWVQVLVI